MKFNEKLRLTRKTLGLRQQDIADIFGIKSVNISDWENGKTMPEASRLPLLAKKLGLSISELMGEMVVKDPFTGEWSKIISWSDGHVTDEPSMIATHPGDAPSSGTESQNAEKDERDLGDVDDVVRLLQLYAAANPAGKAKIMNSARATAIVNAAKRLRNSTHKT